MNLSRNDLRKILNNFNSVSNRLMQANFNDYSDVLSKFLVFIKDTPIIYDYIIDCGECNIDIEEELRKIIESNGQCVFALGNTPEEEIRNVFAILDFIIDRNIEVPGMIGLAYGSTRKYQDQVKGFNDRVVMVLIRYLEVYLSNLGIDMGLDEKNIYNVTVHNGQVNIDSINPTMSVNDNSVRIDYNELAELINLAKSNAAGLSEEDTETVDESLQTIQQEIKKNKPNRRIVNMALSALKAIKGSAEFCAAVASLTQFIKTFI